MTDQTRLVAGHSISASALLGNDAYLVANWTRTSDMESSDEWLALDPERGMRQQQVAGVSLGTGGFYGGYTGVIEFLMLTPQMRDYLENDILNNVGIGKVTIYTHDPRDQYQMNVFQCEMVSPFATGKDSYERFDDTRYWNVRYELRRGVVLPVRALRASAGTNPLPLLSPSEDAILLVTF